jgi:hypothetical protein
LLRRISGEKGLPRESRPLTLRRCSEETRVRTTAAAETASLSPKGKIAAELLVSDSNPDGWALDEPLARVRTEFEVQLRALDTRDPKVRAKRLAYDHVIVALWEAEGRYRALGSHRNWG